MKHEIDVALTYASEQQAYVGSVARELKDRCLNVFFAPFEKQSLWGEDLASYLDRVYRELSTICVMFISREYVAKSWPSHERQIALSRQLKQDAAYILPVRFDDTQVPGLNPNIAFVWASEFSPAELAEAIREKLRTAQDRDTQGSG